jgi:hypothetical protein
MISAVPLASKLRSGRFITATSGSGPYRRDGSARCVPRVRGFR